MATSNTLQLCSKCPKGVGQVSCGGCQHWFCIKHLLEHRQDLSQRMDQLALEHDQLQQKLKDLGDDQPHPLLDRVNRWELKSIERIKELAKDARDRLTRVLEEVKRNLQGSLSGIKTALQDAQDSASYTEIDMDRWMKQFNELKQQLEKPTMITLTNDDDEGKDIGLSIHIPLIQLRIRRGKQGKHEERLRRSFLGK